MIKLSSADILIQWLLDKKLVFSRYDKFLNEQMIEITSLGISVNAVLNKLNENSKEAYQTNLSVAEKLKESEKNEL